MPKIAPISGFPEYLPAQQLALNTIASKIRSVYEGFGYVPLETAAVERIDTLVAKGVDSKEVYALRRLAAEGTGNADDLGAKELALKFDLTVPLARYVAQNYADLVFPFRRYQMQPVFRGERAQRGRYRQFYQFDLDYIAENTLPLAADAEVIAAAHQALTAILPEGAKFTMRLNNRKLLSGLIEAAGYPENQIAAVIKIVDDMEKAGEEITLQRLLELNAQPDINKLMSFLKIRSTGELSKLKGLNATADEGLQELQTVLAHLNAFLSGHSGNILPDLTIARGLDYYTGTVLETTLHSAEYLGSICSGGRYDNLAESLSERKLPGVGISIGLSRLFDWLQEQPPYNAQGASTAQFFVPCPEKNADDNAALTATQLATQLRNAGFNVEQSLHPQPIGTQLQKAQKRGIPQAVLPQADGTVKLRTLATREDQPFPTPTALLTHLNN